MRAYARKLAEDAEKVGVVGLLHDFDYERWPDPTEPSAPKAPKSFAKRGYTDDVIYALSRTPITCPTSATHLMDRRCTPATS